MKKIKKAREYNSPKLSELLAEITPLEMEKTKVKMQISTRIEELMEQRGLNKSDFADLLGKHPSEITKWMSGTQNFTIEILTEIAFSLGVDLSVFFDKKQVQVIYKKEIVVKANSSQPSILISTPIGEGNVVYGIYRYTSNRNKLISSQIYRA